MNIYTIDNSKEWDDIVKSFKDYDVYYLSGYVKAFYQHGDGMPLLFYYTDENIRVMNVVMCRDIANFSLLEKHISPRNYFDISTPYGYGGYLFEGNVTSQTVNRFFDIYSEYCREHNIVSEFIRFNPLTQNHSQAFDYVETVTLGPTVAIELASDDLLWTNFKGNNRRNIKKAQRAGLSIRYGRSRDLMDTFREIYEATMHRDQADDYYYFDRGFYESILDDLPENSLIFYAMLKDTIISMAIILMANQNMHYHLSGSLSEYNDLRPSNLLLYEAAKWGIAQGYKQFHLGGGLNLKEDNLLRFKASFNRSSSTYFTIGKNILKENLYQELVNLRQQSDNFDAASAYFPLYRA